MDCAIEAGQIKVFKPLCTEKPLSIGTHQSILVNHIIIKQYSLVIPADAEFRFVLEIQMLSLQIQIKPHGIGTASSAWQAYKHTPC